MKLPATTLKESVSRALNEHRFGRLEKAKAIYHQILRQLPDRSAVFHLLGKILAQQSQLDAAIACFQKAIYNDPQFAIAYLSFGKALQAKERIEAAIDSYKKAIDLGCEVPEVYLSLGDLYQATNRVEIARPCYQKAANYKNPNLALELHFNSDFNYGPSCVWDPWLVPDGDVYRVFYLMEGRNDRVFWQHGNMCVGISQDLKTWQYLGVALAPSAGDTWDSGRICAGSLYKEKQIYYLWYSAAPARDIFDERIGLATSEDGVRWQRSPQPSLEPDWRFYGRSQPLPFSDTAKTQARVLHWRDPYPVRQAETGKYYLFFTAAVTDESSRSAVYKGCVGVAVGDAIAGPFSCLPPVAYPEMTDIREGIFYELERPQIIPRNGKFFLFFSCWTAHINPKWIERVGMEKITGSSLYCYVSDLPEGPYLPIAEKPVVPGSDRTGLYATQLTFDPRSARWFACGWYPENFTLEVSTRFPVVWEGDRVEIVVEGTGS